MSQKPHIVEADMIVEDHRLEELCQTIRDAGWVAFDTEFVGEVQYRPEACLIQAATEGSCMLIDPLASLDVRPFWELIADSSVLIIVHAGSEDISQCHRETGKPPTQVYDLQIAAGMVGYGYPISLSRLAKLVIGRRIHKSQTLTDWRKRPLSDEQIRYATEDVVHLKPMYDRIQARILDQGRAEWVREECDAACAAASTTEGQTQKLKRLKGSGSLSGKELAIAYALIDAREILAQQYNRPVRTIIKDHILVEIAKRGWSDINKIKTLRGLSLKASGYQLLADAVKKASDLPREAWPELLSQEDSSQEEVLMSLLTAVLRDHCTTRDFAYSLVSKKQHLRALVRRHTRPNEPARPNPLDEGWREALIGDLLNNVITGSRAVRVTPRGKKLGLSVE